MLQLIFPIFQSELNKPLCHMLSSFAGLLRQKKVKNCNEVKNISVNFSYFSVGTEQARYAFKLGG